MSQSPNIILILTDQQRADFFASEGFALDTMPFVDELGRGGARFRRAYTPCPACVPARCSLFSGRFPKATRVRENSAAGHMVRTRDLPETLRELGYSLILAGKNHSYLKDADFDAARPYMHTGGGRDRSVEEAAFDRWLDGLNHGVAPAPTPFPLECQLPYRIVRDAVEMLEAHDRAKPFFLWLSFPEPHNPYQVPEPYFSLFPESDVPPPGANSDEGAAKGPRWRWLQRLVEEKRPGSRENWRRYRANYCGMIRLIDDQIRWFIGELKARGLYDDTLFIFASDHGDYAGDYGLARKGVGLPECLVRVPLLFQGPGVQSRDEGGAFVSLVDLYPTLCDMLGVPAPYGVQGRSLWPMLSGQEYDPDGFGSIFAEAGYGGEFYGEDERPPLHFPYEGPTYDELNSVTQSGNLKMLRRDRWKLLFDRDGHGELYDLATDPMELRDLWHDPSYASTRARLVEELLTWTIRTEDDLPTAKYTPKRASRAGASPPQPGAEVGQGERVQHVLRFQPGAEGDDDA